MKNKLFTIGMFGILTVFMFSGCYNHWHKVEGNYDLVQETRQLSTFTQVSNEGEFDVYIIQDSLSEVTIEAESNLIPLIQTQVHGNSLEIKTKDNLQNNYPMKIYVHTSGITDVSLSGSGLIHMEDIEAGNVDVTLSGSGNIFVSGTFDILDCSISGSGSADIGVEANQIQANISGSGEMEIWGTADKGEFDISGSGSISAYEMVLQECYATISGSGNMQVTVEDYLNVKISGSGSVYYMGTPVIESNISGSGNIIHP